MVEIAEENENLQQMIDEKITENEELTIKYKDSLKDNKQLLSKTK